MTESNHYVQSVYTPDNGELTLYDGQIIEVIRIRHELQNQAMLAACITELERLGYMVLPPISSDEPSTYRNRRT